MVFAVQERHIYIRKNKKKKERKKKKLPQQEADTKRRTHVLRWDHFLAEKAASAAASAVAAAKMPVFACVALLVPCRPAKRILLQKNKNWRFSILSELTQKCSLIKNMKSKKESTGTEKKYQSLTEGLSELLDPTV